jgi:2'-5' RNA ligase
MFFGLWPDPATRATFAGEDKTVFGGNGGKLVPPEEFHVTLRYMGVVPPPLVPAVEALGAQAAKVVGPTMIEFDEVQWWKEAKVLVRVARNLPRPLFDLDQALQVGLRSAGVAVDPKPLKLHLTLVRNIPPHPNGLGRAVPLAWDADSLALIEGSSDPGGPRYRVRKQWKLGLTS